MSQHHDRSRSRHETERRRSHSRSRERHRRDPDQEALDYFASQLPYGMQTQYAVRHREQRRARSRSRSHERRGRGTHRGRSSSPPRQHHHGNHTGAGTPPQQQRYVQKPLSLPLPPPPPVPFVSIDGPQSAHVEQLVGVGGSGGVYTVHNQPQDVNKVMSVDMVHGVPPDALRELDVYSHLRSYRLACMRHARIRERPHKITGMARTESLVGVVWGEIVFTLPRATFGGLTQYVRERKLLQPDHEGDLIALIYDVLAGVAQLHEHGLVHADIRADNFLVYDMQSPNDSTSSSSSAAASAASLPRRPLLQVCDFGRCVQALPTISPRTAYKDWAKAPEVWAEVPFGAPADVYALAWTISFLVTGKHLLRDELKACNSSFSKVKMVLTDFSIDTEHKLLEHISKYIKNVHLATDLANLLAGMVLWDPTKRTTLSSALKHRLFRGVPHNISDSTIGTSLCGTFAPSPKPMMDEHFWAQLPIDVINFRHTVRALIELWCKDMEAKAGSYCTAVSCMDRTIVELRAWSENAAAEASYNTAALCAYACAFVGHKLTESNVVLEPRKLEEWQMRIRRQQVRVVPSAVVSLTRTAVKQRITMDTIRVQELMVRTEAFLVQALQGRISVRLRTDAVSPWIHQLVEACLFPGRLTMILQSPRTLSEQLQANAVVAAPVSATAARGDALTFFSKLSAVA